VEEKYQKESKPVKGQYGDKYDEDSSDSEDEDEDDEGFLATEALDAEISATLQAIRNKDPRVYDEKITFYAPIEEDSEDRAPPKKEEKPMYLRDYHRENLLKGISAVEEIEDAPPLTFAQEQEQLKNTVVKEMHAAAEAEAGSDDDEDGGFLIPKSKPQQSASQGIHPSRQKKIKLDVAKADKDPETFLSNFMAARAWVPTDGARFQPLESEDEEEVERAEKFEVAYNLRFEDPKGSNEVLKSYARDIIAEKSVRREEPKSRKKARDAEREKKEAEKREREEERTRLRKLKIEQMEEKLQKIKKAAGLSGKTLKDDEWSKFLDDNWDDENWEAEMNKRFGEEYYAEPEVGDESDEEDIGASKKKNKPVKPKWDDDIDIKDIIPNFVEEEETAEKPAFTLSDSEDDEEDESNDEETAARKKSSKDRKRDLQDKKKAARLERKKIEELVDTRLTTDLPLASSKSKQPSRFRYRETSPISFGLTARDILMADDAALNQYVGLKKMATFRDADKKKKDKKRLGKKARLREWRKETFGNEDGPEIVIGTKEEVEKQEGSNIIEGKKKKKRSRGPKSGEAEV
jgi:protein KRI1